MAAGIDAVLAPAEFGGVCLIVLYSIQAEIRFGQRARSGDRGADDRGTTLAVSFASAVPVLGFVVAVMSRSGGAATNASAPQPWRLPPGADWGGVVAGVLGLALRMWSVLTLRERYTRTLLVHEAHTVERRGPYRAIRHPGYLGSLLCLNGIAWASGSALAAAASLLATIAAYAYRIHAEERMLLARFGEEYARYRRETGSLLPGIPIPR